MNKNIYRAKMHIDRRTLLRGGVVVGGSVLLGVGGTILWLDTRPEAALYTFQQYVCGVTWSPTGKKLAALTSEGAFIVWNTSSYTIIYSDRKAESALSIGAIAWSPNDQYVASSDQNHAVRIWNTTTWSSITDNSTNETSVGALAWSPDSKFVAIGSADKLVRIYRVTIASLAELVFTYAQHQDEVTSLAWSSDGKYIASGSLDASVHIWSPSTGNTYTTLSNQTTHPIRAVIWSPNNQMLALTFGPKEDNLQPMSNYIVQVLQAQSGALISTYSGHSDYIEALAWSPDGTSIASASDDTTVHIWKPKQTQATYIYLGHTARVKNVAWAPDNIHLATASEDQTLQVWRKPGG